MDTTTGIRGNTVRTLPKRSKTYTGGRTCSHPGCITKISVYNRSDKCYLHATARVPRLRGKKAA